MRPASLTRFLRDESGSNAIEYGLLAGLIAVVIIVSVIMLGDNVKAMYERIEFKFPGA